MTKKLIKMALFTFALGWCLNSWGAEVELSITCKGTKFGKSAEDTLDCDSNPQLKPGTLLTIEAKCSNLIKTDIEYNTASDLEFEWYSDDDVDGKATEEETEISGSNSYDVSSYRFTVPDKNLDSFVGVYCRSTNYSDYEYTSFDYTVKEGTGSFTINTIDFYPSQRITNNSDSQETDSSSSLPIVSTNPIVDNINVMVIPSTELEATDDYPEFNNENIEKRALHMAQHLAYAVETTLAFLGKNDDATDKLIDEMATALNPFDIATDIAEAVSNQLGLNREDLDDLLGDAGISITDAPAFFQTVIYLAIFTIDDPEALIDGNVTEFKKYIPLIFTILRDNFEKGCCS